MKKKMIYEAPVTEQMEIRFEQNFLDSTKSATSVENANYYDNQDWD